MSYTPSNNSVRSSNQQTDYEVIDIDPHFNRVVSYFRPQDYIVWGATTVALPLLWQVWEKIEPISQNKKLNPMYRRTGAVLGFGGGFLLAYVSSSKRFFGWSENAREVAKDRYQTKSLLAQGKFPFGVPTLDDRLQDVASRNSTYSALITHVIPWFNLVSHPYHGVDLKKYYEVRKGEENWGFELKPLDEIFAKTQNHVE